MTLHRFVYPYKDISVDIEYHSFFIYSRDNRISFQELFGKWSVFIIDSERVVESEKED